MQRFYQFQHFPLCHWEKRDNRVIPLFLPLTQKLMSEAGSIPSWHPATFLTLFIWITEGVNGKVGWGGVGDWLGKAGTEGKEQCNFFFYFLTKGLPYQRTVPMSMSSVRPHQASPHRDARLCRGPPQASILIDKSGDKSKELNARIAILTVFYVPQGHLKWSTFLYLLLSVHLNVFRSVALIGGECKAVWLYSLLLCSLRGQDGGRADVIETGDHIPLHINWIYFQKTFAQTGL